MIKNYLKIALRNLLKYKMISGINLLGLTVGLTCCLLIFVYVLNELSYDKFNTNADRIYRVTRTFNTQDGQENLHLAAVAPPFATLLKNEFSDIEQVTRIFLNGHTVKYKDKIFTEWNAYYAEENFFDFFSVPVIKGNSANALRDPGSVMLSQEIATKYFGNEDPMNKLLKVDNQGTYKVSGIFSSFPDNAHFRPEILISFNALKDSLVYGERQLNSNFTNNAFFTYVMFPRDYPVNTITPLLPGFIDKCMQRPGSMNKASKFTQLHFQKLTDIHLYSQLDSELETNGDIKRVYIFSSIALFILLIACINFMNLSTARSATRAKEIGIRKVIGAVRKELIFQFLGESVLIVFISLVFAWFLTYLALPFINKISDQHLVFSSLLHTKIIAGTLLLPFVLGILSGIYPALFLSSFNPSKVLKGFFKSDKGISFRKVLVVSQFAISIILIVATLVVFRQLNYMQNISLGFDKECVITMRYPGELNQNYQGFRNNLLNNPLVKEVARSSRTPTSRLLDDLGGVSVVTGDTMAIVANADVKHVTVDDRFIPAYNIKMAAGRNFSPSIASDSNNYVLNESAISVLGWKSPQEAINKEIMYGGVRGKIIGVMKDFHFESKHEKIIPLLLHISTSISYDNLTIKTGKNIKEALRIIEQTWSNYLPDTPFQYMFMDYKIAWLYHTEEQQAKLFMIFSCIAIFIACLGLFGLSIFTISQRIKEIGIRKVLGANIPEIVRLLSADFLKLVLIAAFVGLPLSSFLMNKWLQDFAYRINIPWWAFVLSSMAAFVIAFFTISIQSLKAAASNPVKNLRTE